MSPGLMQVSVAVLRAALADDQPVVEVVPGPGAETAWELRGADGSAVRVLVQVRSSLAPAEVRGVPRPVGGPTLVVSRFLSPRTRQLLEARAINYLDLTGNILLRTARPTIYLRLQGAERDPEPAPRGASRLLGPKAHRLARLLVDFRPPFPLPDLANAAGISAGYLSRLLAAMSDEALVDRAPRGAVTHADWPALLMSVAGAYAVIPANSGRTFVAPAGATALYRQLTTEKAADVVVTGSFAAAAVSPVAAPAQLMLYAEDDERIVRSGKLLPADSGANVVLLRPGPMSPTARPRVVHGLRHVALSQLVLDCLSGPGRLPEEGEAVLTWMRANEDTWRQPLMVITKSG